MKYVNCDICDYKSRRNYFHKDDYKLRKLMFKDGIIKDSINNKIFEWEDDNGIVTSFNLLCYLIDDKYYPFYIININEVLYNFLNFKTNNKYLLNDMFKINNDNIEYSDITDIKFDYIDTIKNSFNINLNYITISNEEFVRLTTTSIENGWYLIRKNIDFSTFSDIFLIDLYRMDKNKKLIPFKNINIKGTIGLSVSEITNGSIIKLEDNYIIDFKSTNIDIKKITVGEEL